MSRLELTMLRPALASASMRNRHPLEWTHRKRIRYAHATLVQTVHPHPARGPADAEVASHQLLLRAGYIRQLGAGIYSYLPLGTRSINKIVAIVREEMDTIGAGVLPARAAPARSVGRERPLDRHGRQHVPAEGPQGRGPGLGMTHEEVMTSIARNEMRSYKQLPQIWYQIQTKFRDEPRPKSGLLRVRQFTMKDSYSFDIDAGRAGRELRPARRGLPPHLHALRPGVRRGRCGLRRHGRIAVAGVHGVHRGR